jgi:hypothetical protein
MNPMLDCDALDRRPDESGREWYERLMKLDPDQLSPEGRQLVGTRRREAARAFREEVTSMAR